MMSSDQRKTANAISGKTARACDSCLSKRARWFCVADDAFLCQSCDVSVHSANLLASRHQRVRLGTSSSSTAAASLLSSPKIVDDDDDDSPPAWHRGFTRKPRTPRNAKRTKKQNSGGVAVEESVNPVLPFVPEMGSDDDYNNNNEIDLFCQVPVLLDDDLNALLNDGGGDDHMRGLEIPEFLSSDVELAEFAADVETLLGDDDVGEDKATAAVKIEINGGDCTEALNWSFGEEQEVEQKVMMTMLSGFDESSSSMESGSCKEEVAKKSRMLLSLNYEEVISAWASQGCPWTDGTRPHFDPNHCWPDFMGGDHHHHHPYGSAMMMRRSDEGREARVSRYREKRRTRLFSKKIRYEVRKLNAEKRPRLKGRFVKRSSLFQPPPPFPNYLLNRHL
ncbi:PREDICTED: zinc finger protein CONSTANS-LIKE 16 [Ipomoea nil]|uniref:zinc finger protein CONSTANS-LIKE 16 n=1 Tax=Ipomoea nil TaxID=35883 RepID=UPI000900EC61|nr:PREDICTED: zinc finger protein CONSTANS-LIKE 16 [Ipomoea nil]